LPKRKVLTFRSGKSEQTNIRFLPGQRFIPVFLPIFCESGSEARACDFDWIMEIRDLCVENNISFWFKQTGAKGKDKFFE
jgi:hypothetical protein